MGQTDVRKCSLTAILFVIKSAWRKKIWKVRMPKKKETEEKNLWSRWKLFKFNKATEAAAAAATREESLIKEYIFPFTNFF